MISVDEAVNLVRAAYESIMRYPPYKPLTCDKVLEDDGWYFPIFPRPANFIKGCRKFAVDKHTGEVIQLHISILEPTEDQIRLSRMTDTGWKPGSRASIKK